jgi:protein-tyrosine phosphatase
VIDLHCHILPGLDDGPANLDFSLAMARTAVASGTQMMVATPHVRADFDVNPDDIADHVEALNEDLKDERLPLRVLPGAEIGWANATELSDEQLSMLSLGSGRRILLESPYGRRAVDVEGIVEDLSGRGFDSILAHPERCPLFQREPDRLRRLVDGGVLCSITAGSLLGRFGDGVREFAIDLLRRGLVHDVASDSHDHIHRPPGLIAGFESAESDIPGIASHASWYTVRAPVAILAGNRLPAAPDIDAPPQSRLKRLLGRRDD